MKRTIVFEKRMAGTSGGVLAIRLLAIAAALLVTAVFLLLTGRSVGQVANIYNVLFIETFFTKYGIMDTLSKAIPLMIAATGMALSFKMKLWNTGGEGQIVMGAIAAAAVAMNFQQLPAPVMIPLMLIAAFIAGALWAWVAAIPKAYLGVNETITTLMLNYVALIVSRYLVFGPWKDPAAGGFPTTPQIVNAARLPYIPGTTVHMGIVVALLLVVLYAVVLGRSRWGYEVRVIGESQQAARYAGMDVKKNILFVLGSSGGLAGIAGFSQLAGTTYRLETGLSGGYGYTAIIIAWLSRLSPIGLVLMSIFMGGLIVGGTAVRTEGLPASIAGMIQGIILFFVLGFDILTQYRIRIVKKEQAENSAEGRAA